MQHQPHTVSLEKAQQYLLLQHTLMTDGLDETDRETLRLLRQYFGCFSWNHSAIANFMRDHSEEVRDVRASE